MKKYLILLLIMAVMAWGGKMQYVFANEGHQEKKGSDYMGMGMMDMDEDGDHHEDGGHDDDGDEDGDHDDSDGHSHEGSEKSKVMMRKTVDDYQYVFSMSSENPLSGEETGLEFEITNMRGAEDNLGEGFPVTDVKVTIRVKELSTSLEKSDSAHEEGNAGVYGIHYVFPSRGSYLVSLEWKDVKGKNQGVSFNIKNVGEGSEASLAEEGHHDEEKETDHDGEEHDEEEGNDHGGHH